MDASTCVGVAQPKCGPMLYTGPMVRRLLDGSKTQTRRGSDLPHASNLGIWQPDMVGGAGGGVDRYGREQTLRAAWTHSRSGQCIAARYGVGDRIWVREAIIADSDMEAGTDGVRYLADDAYVPVPIDSSDPNTIGQDAYDRVRWYGNDDPAMEYRIVPSIHMPRWASRITLEITGIAAQRLRDITDEDAKAEGLSCLTKDGGRVYKYGIPDRDGWPGNDNDGWHWAEWEIDPRQAYFRLWDKINGKGSADRNPPVFVYHFKRITP